MSSENEHFYDLAKTCVHSLKTCLPAFTIYLVRSDISSVIYALLGPSLGEYVICIKLYFNTKHSKKSSSLSGVCLVKCEKTTFDTAQDSSSLCHRQDREDQIKSNKSMEKTDQVQSQS